MTISKTISIAPNAIAKFQEMGFARLIKKPNRHEYNFKPVDKKPKNGFEYKDGVCLPIGNTTSYVQAIDMINKSIKTMAKTIDFVMSKKGQKAIKKALDKLPQKESLFAPPRQHNPNDIYN